MIHAPQVSYAASLVTDGEVELIVANGNRHTAFRKHLVSGCRTTRQGSCRPAAHDWMGGGDIRSKDMAVLHQGPETFISVMVVDGVFERHPGLRGASVELGKDPIGCFETSLGQRPADARDNFHAENFLRIFLDARVH